MIREVEQAAVPVVLKESALEAQESVRKWSKKCKCSVAQSLR